MATSSPKALTPSSSCAVNKPLAPMQGICQAPNISTNKEWVVPPRPKPGRKPVLEAPPTKRKAQNREAQRAFRERRAAKVGDLEEHMKRVEDDHYRESERLRRRIKGLESDLEDYSHKLLSWQESFREMEAGYEREKQRSETAEREAEVLRQEVPNATAAVALPPRQSKKNEATQEQSPPAEESKSAPADIMTCGKCSHGSCPCIEAVFEMSDTPADPSSTLKRPHSPPSITDNKRPRQENGNYDFESMETDINSRYTNNRPPTFPTSASTSSMAVTALLDPCGFCQDGTPCICAEISKEQSHYDERLTSPKVKSSSSGPEIEQPSLATAISKPCINGPGTCAQCLTNPTCELFCKSLAVVSFSTTSPSARASKIDTRRNPNVAIAGPTLSCANAFTTLSKHHAFDRASSELGTWVPQLTAIPAKVEEKHRTASEIDVASLLTAWSNFDRWYGDHGSRVNGR